MVFGPLKVEWMGNDSSGTANWRLLEPMLYDGKHDIHVPKGFRSDGLTIPKFSRIFFPSRDPFLPAAILHDYLWRRWPGPTPYADRVFYEALGDLGVPNWRRWPMWAFVRLAAHTGWVRPNARSKK